MDKVEEYLLRHLKEYWTPRDMTHARSLILRVAEWDEYTSQILPRIFSDVVRGRLGSTESKVALEIGCGIGRMLKVVAPLFKTVVGIDISPGMVELSRDYLADVENVEVLVNDGRYIPLSDNSVDFVFSVIVFQHLPYREFVHGYLKESLRVLKLGGVIRIQMLKGESHLRVKAYRECRYPDVDQFALEFSNAGFSVLESWTENDYLWVTGEKPHS